QHTPGPAVAPVGVRLDLAAADRDQGELGAHEEGVDDQGRQSDQQLYDGHRDVPPSSVGPAGSPSSTAGSTSGACSRTRAARWPVASTTSSRQPATSRVSPVSGIRPSEEATSPARVSYGPSGTRIPTRASRSTRTEPSA